MPTIVTSVMFLPKAKPLAGVAADGKFQLTLRLLDRIAPGRTEAWQVYWTGAEAQAWWQQHHANLVPGTPLAVRLHSPRTHFDRLSRSPEIHARAEHIEEAPRAHQSQSQSEAQS